MAFRTIKLPGAKLTRFSCLKRLREPTGCQAAPAVKNGTSDGMRWLTKRPLVLVLAVVALMGLSAPAYPQSEEVILECDVVGIVGDRADMRGIRFTVDRNFSAVEVRMDGQYPSTYGFTAELRRSTGFTAPVEASSNVSVYLPGDYQNNPYPSVHIGFPEIAVSGSETFTLKFSQITGQGLLYFETAGIGNFPCPGIEVTTENNVANPTLRSSAAGLRVLGPALASLYGVNAADDGLSLINPANGHTEFIGPLDPDPDIYATPVAMAIRSSDNRIFVWNNSNAGASTGVLLTVDQRTGRATPVNPSAPPQGNLQALTFGTRDVLYGLEYDLFYIDTKTGLITEVGNLGGPRIAGADFAYGKILYGLTFDRKLVTIDPGSAKITRTVNLNVDVGIPGSLAFNPGTGQLLGSAFDGKYGDIIFDIDSTYGTVSNIRKISAEMAPQGMDFAVPLPPPLYISLHIEDALEGIAVNKVVGDTTGPTHWTRLEIVAKLVSFSSTAKDDIPVVLSVPGDAFGAPINTWVRNSDGGSLSAVGYDNLGGGQYRVTTDLSPVIIWPGFTLYYRKQIVWRFLIPNELSPQNVFVTAEIQKPSIDPSASGTVRIVARGSVRSIMIANRKLLYDKYADSSVSGLLQRLFTEAQGPPASHSPFGVVYYLERYDARAYNWDNTTVDYTSEATANVVPNAIDDLIEDWHDDATQYVSIYIPLIGTIRLPISWPNYLLIVGDDDTIPFYRYNDPSNDEGIDKISWCDHGWCVDSATNPAVHATDEDYLLTDNPYADLGGGTDWRTGDLELWVGRILGASAADMLSLLEEGVDWDNGQQGGVVMASVDGWELGLEPDDGRAGEIADLHDVPALFRGKGFAVRNDDVPTSEVRTIDVMSPFEGGNTSWNTNFRNAANNAAGMDLFFIGGHDSYDHAVIPGDDFSPDDTPGTYTRFDNDHPITMIVGCHGGLPVPDIDLDGGADNCMVYDLIHEGARAYIGASGFSYGSPGNLHKCTWAERLIQRFFHNMLTPLGVNSMTIGKAMTEAKHDYVFGFGSNDALDRKTVTEFNLFGVPWAFLWYPAASFGEEYAAEPSQEKAFTTERAAIMAAAQESSYTQTFVVKIKGYEVSEEWQDRVRYDIISVPGGDLAISPGAPVLPFVEGYTLPLPFAGTVTDVRIVNSESAEIGKYNIPIAEVQPWTEGGLRYTTETNINYFYPKDAELVQYQQTGDGVTFTVFPIQHNPTTDVTIFYSSFEIQVTYESPLTVTVTDFATNKQRYAPGEPVGTTTQISNVGEVDATLTATLAVRDMLGEVMGTQTSDSFVVPSGGTYRLSLDWVGELGDGSYSVEVKLLSQQSVVGGASAEISVVGGEISALAVPETLRVRRYGSFKVTFANYRPFKVSGLVRLTIQDKAGGISENLPPQPITVAGQSSNTAAFEWMPVEAGGGDYSATATVTVQGQDYGPTSESFVVLDCVCLGDLAGTDGFSDPDGKVDTGDMAKLLSELILGGGGPANNYKVQSPSRYLLSCGDLAGTDGFSAQDGQIDTGDMAKLLSELILNGDPDNNYECGCVVAP